MGITIAIAVVSGLVMGICFLPISKLIDYIKAMDVEEEDLICGSCSQRERCIAQRDIGKSNVVTEFTYTAFLLVQKTCMYEGKFRPAYMLILTIINTLLYVILAWNKGFCADTILCCFFTTVLICVATVDWKTRYIPIEFNIVLLILGIVRLLLTPDRWLERLIGLVAVSGFLILTDIIGGKLSGRGHVIGGGDIKLMAAAGLFLGWKLNIVALMVGCVVGTILHLIIMKIGKGERQLAFGPYLSMGIYIAMIFGEQLMSWYLKLMGM